MASSPRLSLTVVTLILGGLLAACGAKTGLRVRPSDASQDAPVDDAPAQDIADVRDVVDASDADAPSPPDVVVDAPDVVEPLEERCVERRVVTTLGQMTTVIPGLDRVVERGYRWELEAIPPGSRTTITMDDAPSATLTPDRPGQYRVVAHVRRQFGVGELRCPILVTANLADPRCPGEALVEPQIVQFPSMRSQLGLDPAWIAVRRATGSDAAFITADDDLAGVSAVALERPATDSLENHSLVVEAQLRSPLGAIASLIGRMLRTPDGTPVRRSTFRFNAPSPTTADRVRDQIASIVSNSMVPRVLGLRHGSDTAFFVELTAALRADVGSVYFLITVAPVSATENTARATASRVEDFVNGSALTTAGRINQIVCDLDRATRTAKADFLWFVDTSGSMNNDQQLVGQSAQQFFRDLEVAGVDFRVGVFQAGSATPVLAGPPPFDFVLGTNPMGALQVAYRVTSQPFAMMTADMQRPFPNMGGSEEPAACSVLTIQEFERRAAAGETNPNFVFRDDAVRVVFWVTDEPGTNDDGRFFGRDQTRWGNTITLRTQRIADFFRSRGVLPFGLVPIRAGWGCDRDATNLLSCVITAAGGAFVPINETNVAERDMAFRAAMSRVVASTAGAGSEFSLSQPPISSSIRVRLVDRIVPRSRADGFDYDGVANSLVFRGSMFRPRTGDEVRSAYFTWRAP
jgi:hypothetical protein